MSISNAGPMTEKVSDYIFRHIAESTGVRHVFMLPGGGCMHLVDSLGSNRQLTYVPMLHEQACAIAAEAYAQYNGELGVALVTAGPGSTNAITGVAGAWIDSTPLLILSGQAKHTELMNHRGMRQMGIQEVDIVSMVSPVTKYAVCLTDPENARYELEKALYLATHGRKGPVWLDIPVDIQGALIDPAAQRPFRPEPEPRCDYEAAASAILTALAGAKRPALYVGNGVRAAGAVGEMLKFAERYRLPVMTSWKAADMIAEDHPLFVGRPGIIAQRGANFVQQTCDFLLLLGTRLDLCQTGFNAPGFAPHARKIIIDIDQPEIDKLEMPFAAKFAMDCGGVLKSLLAAAAPLPDYSLWLSHCKSLQRKYPVILPKYCDESKPLVNLYHLVEVLSDLLEPGDLLVPGSSGACAEVTMQAFKVKLGERVQNTPGLGSMGFGLPAVIGACIASGGRRSVGVVGDGGLQHNIQELQTLKNHDLPIKFLVLNNGGYGSIVNMQRGRFEGRYVASNPASGLNLPDLHDLAGAYKLRYVKVASPRKLKDQLAAILAMPGTVICEVMLDPDVPSEPKLASEMLPDGRMVSKPMEDLAPFLDRAEFEENMRVVR